LGINEDNWLDDIEAEHEDAIVEVGENNLTLFDVL